MLQIFPEIVWVLLRGAQEGGCISEIITRTARVVASWLYDTERPNGAQTEETLEISPVLLGARRVS